MKKTVFLISVLTIFACSKLLAQGNLLVTPIRVIFDEKKSREDLNVCNIGSDTAVYIISFLHYKMKEDGSFLELQKGDSSVQYADEFLRIFPRRVKLAPNESQIVRLQFRKTPNLKEGEYRSHLYFRADKIPKPMGFDDKKDDKTMSISITPIFGISIPVFVRNGNLKSDLKLSNIVLNSVNDSISKLSLDLNREGDMSVYGNFSVSFLPESGKLTPLAQANGIGVYPEIAKRNYTITLKSKELVNNPKGKLILTFTKPHSEGSVEIARTEYILNPK